MNDLLNTETLAVNCPECRHVDSKHRIARHYSRCQYDNPPGLITLDWLQDQTPDFHHTSAARGIACPVCTKHARYCGHTKQEMVWALSGGTIPHRKGAGGMNQLADIKAMAETLPKREIRFSGGELYLVRYALHGWMPDNKVVTPANVYLHHILLPDEDGAPHSHPWEWFRTTVLHGGYLQELVPSDPEIRKMVNHTSDTVTVGDTREMRSDNYHRISTVLPDTWTLVITGPKVASWGFMVDGAEVPWRDRLLSRGIQPAY